MKEIPLTQGKVAQVDDADYERVSAHKWCADKHVGPSQVRWYAQRRVNNRTQRMHSFIMGTNSEIDHIDHDGLNNQKGNFRFSSRSQNNQNQRVKKHTSKYKGICKQYYLGEWTGKWIAQIKSESQKQYIGTFDDEADAAKAYDAAAEHHFGEFAATNKSLGFL